MDIDKKKNAEPALEVQNRKHIFSAMRTLQRKKDHNKMHN